MPTAAPFPSSDARRPAPVARFRLRVTLGEVIAVGPGKITLLEAIAETGSITAAARHVGMSYRRAWLLLDELDGALKRPAVESAQGGPHGGGSVLTDAGRELVGLYRTIERTAEAACRDELKRLRALLAR